ncbi:2-phospho-L-lactate guanylyltransferase [Vibrio hannami]|uniref:2-phospho-L-lactate guanylyltransferase n=1 Tax=Vibrio hannami TaxID=2717094 RepID=UPI00240F8787|nr:2-phospho-L-lactate guanylyltransferase [Vibrio hannami]MDG3087774.1 2-phospho-L-lactate guanylyltransferase [Vibrio hannami]
MLEKLNIVIPMKAPAYSKQRLMGVLNVAQRETLALSLYRETLRFFANHYPQVNRLVVTDSQQIADIAKRYGACTLLEKQSKGLNNAIDVATRWSMMSGYRHQMVIPADIAKLDTDEVSALFQAVEAGNQVVIARAKDSGTNALITTPPNAIEFQYGAQSALAHAQQAHVNQLQVEVLELSALSQDIDVPDDLLRVHPGYQHKEYCYE